MAKKMTAAKFLEKYPRPVILQFQPTHFTILETDAELKGWESQLANDLGFKFAKGRGAALAAAGATATRSGGGVEGAGDCDED